MAPFKSVLIANRGEIAVRIIRTCRDLGMRAVAVYSDADRDALHGRPADEAKRIGYPLMLKAAAGGGGKGMRAVRTADELDAAWRLAASEAQSAFGSPALFLEHLVENARHVEVQILADAHGDIVWVGERDCS